MEAFRKAGSSRTRLAATALLAEPALVLGAAALLALAARFAVPFYPVPMTLQTLVVLLLGAALGPRLAGLAVAAYLLEGAMGLPVFAGSPEKGVGLVYMMGPTGGFLLGFLLAALLVGWLSNRGGLRSPGSAALTMAAGSAAIYLPGLIWLGLLLGFDKPILQWGFYPFLLGDLLKLAIATLVAPVIAKTISRARQR